MIEQSSIIYALVATPQVVAGTEIASESSMTTVDVVRLITAGCSAFTALASLTVSILVYRMGRRSQFMQALAQISAIRSSEISLPVQRDQMGAVIDSGRYSEHDRQCLQKISGLADAQ